MRKILNQKVNMKNKYEETPELKREYEKDKYDKNPVPKKENHKNV